MAAVVVLDRIEPGIDPPYCVHGKCTCVGGCGEWLWLGPATVGPVSRGETEPICAPCLSAAAERMRAAGAGGPVGIGHLDDRAGHG